jgi:hypothetical protein
MSEESAAPTKIEPTLKPVEDAPPLAAAAPEVPAEAPKIELKAVEPKAEEPAKVEASVAPAAPPVAAKEPPAKEPPVLPRVTQIAPEAIASAPVAPEPIAEPVAPKSAPNWLRAGGATKEAKPKSVAPAPTVAPVVAKPAPSARSRFPLLAATVAIAASFGAVAGSFGSAKLFAPAPVAETQTVVRASRESNDEIKALKEMVSQLRANTKTLNDNVSALKLSVSSAHAQLTKLSESLERRAAAPAPAPETTGSIQKPATPVVLGTPPAALQHPVVAGWTLRRVFDGAALIEGREGVIEVEPGITIPGLGRIEDIKKHDGRWAVFTSKGIIVAAGK